jgi:RimJ/RimL family protein N-acetyltransferase
MEMQTAALFNYDDAGRITGTNDGEPPGVAPRLFLGRTRDGNIWRLRNDLPNALAAELASVLETEPTATDLRRPPATLARLRQYLSKEGSEESIYTGPAYQFPPELPESPEARIIDRSNIELVKEHFPGHYPWLVEEFNIRQPIAAIVRDAVAVSICFSARMTSEAAEAGVDTAPDFRGLGFAPQIVSAWAEGVRRLSRVPLYSTSWDNAASQRVASKLGLIMYGADMSLF